MHRTDTIIIGAGQAGLALSRCLTDRGRDHVVLERGRIGERWRSERWDSLHLLTPNWMTRLPGWSYRGPDPDGFMHSSELVGIFERYARSFGAPVLDETTVEAVDRAPDGYRVVTDQGTWTADNVVIATGTADRPYVPPFAQGLAPDIARVTPTHYRNPAQLPDGGVLVVGASSTGVQLADELARSGRDVVIAVGDHTRAVRRYRGRDLFRWLEATGTLDRSIDDMPDPAAARRQPSMQLVGRRDGADIDLGTLAARGVHIAGRLRGLDHHRVRFADDLAASMTTADTRMRRVLRTIDEFVARHGLEHEVPPAEEVPAIAVPHSPDEIDLAAAGITTVLWATGYRRSYPWLHVPVLDRHGEIEHRHGVTPAPGMYVLGMRFQSRRSSNFIDGVGRDAECVADHIVSQSRALGVAV